jgi:hypothetical protein
MKIKTKIHPDLKYQLADEFKCTYQTITMSINGVFNSDNAKAIRKRAKELLIEQANTIEV